MIKIFEFLVRKPGMTREQFNYHWLNVHGPLVISVPEIARHLVRYCQNHLIPEWYPFLPHAGPPCDGVVELWCESIKAVEEMFGAPANLDEVRADEYLFLDVMKGQLLVTREESLYERPGTGETDGSIKVFEMVGRNPRMSRSQCRRYWKDEHAPKILATPEIMSRVRKYSQCHGVEDFRGNIPASQYEGLAEYWFDSTDDLWKAFANRQYREKIRPDEANFQDYATSGAAVAREILIFER